MENATTANMRARWIVIAIIVLILTPYGLWRLFLYSTFAPNTDRAKRGLVEFQAYLAKNGPIPTSNPDQDGKIWSENGITFWYLGAGAGLGFYEDLLCRSPGALKLATPTRYGIVTNCEKMADGYYWIVVRN